MYLCATMFFDVNSDVKLNSFTRVYRLYIQFITLQNAQNTTIRLNLTRGLAKTVGL